MITLKNICKAFGSFSVLRGVSLTIQPERIRVILGLSGSGKSVLLKHIIGLLKPDSGNVIVDELNVETLAEKDMRTLRHRFGMVFQQNALFDSMSVYDNVAFPLREHRSFKEKDIHTKVFEKLSLLNLSESAFKYPAELSGGMRKRVALARAIILNPQCVLYDEPTTGLDPISTRNVEDMILQAKQTWHVTSVLISHDIGSALRIADDIAVLHEGSIVADCTPLELLKHPHPFVQQFLQAWHNT